jgi:hypothetical protein
MRQDAPADGGPDPVIDGDAPDLGGDDTPDAGDGGLDDADLDPAAAGDGDDDPPAAPVVPKVEDKPKDEPKPEEKTDEDDFSKEPEFTTDKNGRKRVNSIPQPRVKKMVENAVTKAVTAKETEHTEKVKTFEKQIAEYEDLGSIMATDPDRFFGMLQSAYPAYKQYAKGGAAPAATPAAPQVNDPMPQPDGRLADGTPAYSPEGFQKVQEWQARQIEDRVLKQVGEKYKYLDDEKATREAREAAIPQVRSQISNAMQQWDGFKENFDAILTELRTDSQEAERTGRAPKLTLHDAYRVVINRQYKAERDKTQKEIEALKVDRNKVREEVIAELRQRPTSTATTPTALVTRPDAADSNVGQPRDTAAIIRESIASMRRAG